MPSLVARLRCVGCGAEHDPARVEYNCPTCGENLDVLYHDEAVKRQVNRDALARNPDRSLWRYRAFLPLAAESRVPPLQVGMTPVYDLPELARAHGVARLRVKDDGRMATGSFKDRASAVAVARALEKGARAIACASTGNAAASLAGICASVGLENYIFVPRTAPRAKIAQLLMFGANVLMVNGTYDQAFDLCRAAADRFGWYSRNTGYNPVLGEGKKTAALELCEQSDWRPPDVVFVPVGDGCILGGLWKGFTDARRIGLVDRLPRLAAVQAEGSSAIVTAFLGDGIVRPGPAHTVADSISVGMPRDGTKALRAIRESGGFAVTVSDAEILEALRSLPRATGVFAEPAAAAAWAGFLKLADARRLDPSWDVLVMLTGNGLKDVETAMKCAPEPPIIEPDIRQVEAVLSRRR